MTELTLGLAVRRARWEEPQIWKPRIGFAEKSVSCRRLPILFRKFPP